MGAGETPYRRLGAMLDTIVNSTALVLSLIGTVVGVAGIVAGYRLRSERIPRYVYDMATVQTRAHPDVSITYRGEQIENLHALQFAFWNSGHREIRSEDLPTVGGPRIILAKGGRVLSLDSRASDIATEARVVTSQEQPNELTIAFRYLNHRDAVYTDVLYTLPSSATNEFTVAGSVIGARRLKGRRWVPEAASRESLIPAALALGFLVAGALRAKLSTAEDAGLYMLAFGVVLSFGGGIQLWQYIRVRAPQWVRDKFPANQRGEFLTSRYINGS